MSSSAIVHYSSKKLMKSKNTDIKTVVEGNECGEIYNVKNIPSKMFEFFIHSRRIFKDRTHNWAIGVSPEADDNKGYVFEYFRGTREEASARLDEIIKSYK